MNKSRPKTMHYKKAESNDIKFNYQFLVSDVLAKRQTAIERKVMKGEKTIQCIKSKRVDGYGIYIHLTSFIEGEQASTIKTTNQEPDLSIAVAPDGEEFMDGDIHVLISNNDLLFCASGTSRESVIKNYFDMLLEEADISRPEYVIKTPARSQILSMLSSGIREINLDAHATALELDKIKKSNSRHCCPAKGQ